MGFGPAPTVMRGWGACRPRRCAAQPAVQAFAGAEDPVEVFAALRRAKDRFR